MNREENPTIWITGASSGIGKETAKEFARTGCSVFVSSRRLNGLERLNKELIKEKLSVKSYPCNVASSVNVEQTAKKILKDYNIDCLINNAGISSFKLAEENSIAEINDIIKTNLLGSIYTIKSVLPGMIKRKQGTIINILSIATKKVFPNGTAYAASKMGLQGYTDSLREEVRKYNIRVINIIPGATDTQMWPADIRKDKSEQMITTADVARIIVWAFLQKGNLVSEEILIRPMKGDI